MSLMTRFAFLTLAIFAFSVAEPAFGKPPTESAVAAKKGAAKKKKTGKKASKGADKLTALFKKLDTNNDGQLSTAEFAKLSTIKKEMKAAKKKTKTKVKNPAKVKAKTEKKKAKGDKKKGKKKGKGSALFTMLDTDKSGTISLTEFKKLPEDMKKIKAEKKAKKAAKAKK